MVFCPLLVYQYLNKNLLVLSDQQKSVYASGMIREPVGVSTRVRTSSVRTAGQMYGNPRKITVDGIDT